MCISKKWGVKAVPNLFPADQKPNPPLSQKGLNPQLAKQLMQPNTFIPEILDFKISIQKPF